MSKKLTAHLMSKLAEGVKRVDDSGFDFSGCYVAIVSEKEAIVKASDDFTLGVGIGMLLGVDSNMVDGLEFKFLANVEYGKLYQLGLHYPDVIEQSVEDDLGLNGEKSALNES